MPPPAGPSTVEWTQTNIQAPLSRVVADHRLLAVPVPQQLLEHHLIVQAGTGVSLDSAAGMAGERTKLVVAGAERYGLAASPAACAGAGAHPGRALRARRAGCDLRSPSASCAARSRAPRASTRSSTSRSTAADGTHASILKDYQVDAVRGGVTHVDLQEVRLDSRSRRRLRVTCSAGRPRRACAKAASSRRRCTSSTSRRCRARCPSISTSTSRSSSIGDSLRSRTSAPPRA